MMETARELFEKMGYKYDGFYRNGELKSIIYTKGNYEIYFRLDDKEFLAVYHDRTQDCKLDKSEMRAVCKQCEELGWLD